MRVRAIVAVMMAIVRAMVMVWITIGEVTVMMAIVRVMVMMGVVVRVRVMVTVGVVVTVSGDGGDIAFSV